MDKLIILITVFNHSLQRKKESFKVNIRKRVIKMLTALRPEDSGWEALYSLINSRLQKLTPTLAKQKRQRGTYLHMRDHTLKKL